MVGRAALIRVVSPTTPSLIGHVKVNADENALAVDIDVADGLLGKGHVCFYLSYVSASHYGRRFLIKGRDPRV